MPRNKRQPKSENDIQDVSWCIANNFRATFVQLSLSTKRFLFYTVTAKAYNIKVR